MADEQRRVGVARYAPGALAVNIESREGEAPADGAWWGDGSPRGPPWQFFHSLSPNAASTF
ncbi:MAG: hypothetical protein DMG06_03885 [Acidobacteria bacterium]|nr:MAG: hypothetical protein DMG06_03885 [Acidobacteriota bacterium]